MVDVQMQVEAVYEKDAGPVPSLEEVQRRLSKIPGEMTADFIAERRERGETEERGER
jgi:hypothetical protein